MKLKILLSILVLFFITSIHAQKRSKNAGKAYAITSVEKGRTGWTEVRLVDIKTGEELKTIYQNAQELEPLNARTGKAIVKTEATGKNAMQASNTYINTRVQNLTKDNTVVEVPTRVTVRYNVEASRKKGTAEEVKKVKVMHFNSNSPRVTNTYKPFATSSAACAYDQKHERLYYTPMGINQLRYIDLKAKSPKIYYFEDEPFGALSGPGDVPNQVTRMVIASDGNGYALTNNAEHLVRFTTKKNPTITDLGALTDDESNGSVSVRSSKGYGGDIVAGKADNLYLITANRRVFSISLETRVAKYLGTIKGLPEGYTTNGAIAEGGRKIIVNSSNSTAGYFRFDLDNLQAEKITTAPVFNSSDLANNVFVADRKKDKKEEPIVEEKPETKVVKNDPPVTNEAGNASRITAYPNPVSNGLVNLSFENYRPGRYQMQFVDMSGKLISSKAITINNTAHVEEFRLPAMITSGNYLVNIIDETSKVVNVSKITVQ